MVTAEGQAGEAACLWVRFDPSVSPLTICLTLLYDFSAVRCTHTKAAEAPRRIIGNILLESVPAMVGALLHTHPEVTATMPSYEERSTKRPDQYGKHRSVFESNKKKILATQNVCGICGKPVDKSFKFPHPLSPSIDHIIPVDKGGHPSDMSNLQLAHLCCNRFKSDKLVEKQTFDQIPETISNRVLPCLIDWKTV